MEKKLDPTISSEAKKGLDEYIAKQKEIEKNNIYARFATELDDILTSAKSHQVMDVYTQIRVEFDKLNNKLEKYIESIKDADEATKQKANSAKMFLKTMEEERIALEKLEQKYKVREGYLKNLEKQADIMRESFSPKKQLEAELISLSIEHERELNEIKKEMRKMLAENMSEKGHWKTADFAEQYKNLQKYLELIEREFEIHKNQKMHPLLTEYKDMLKGWADDLANVLNEALYDMDSFSQGFQDWMVNISKQVSEAAIRRMVTDKALDMFERILYPEKKKTSDEGGKDATAKTGNTLFDGFIKTMEGGWTKVAENIKDGFMDYITNIKDHFIGLLSAIKGMFGGSSAVVTGGGSSGSWVGLLQAGISLAGSLIGGGGSEYGTYQDDPSTWQSSYNSSSGTTLRGSGGFHPHAEGGWIKEPVIGRGLRSGDTYAIGEGGEDELVIPRSKLGSTGSSYSVNVPVTINGSQGIDNKVIAKLKMEMEATALRVLKANL